jgi:hypothetical protein
MKIQQGSTPLFFWRYEGSQNTLFLLFGFAPVCGFAGQFRWCVRICVWFLRSLLYLNCMSAHRVVYVVWLGLVWPSQYFVFPFYFSLIYLRVLHWFAPLFA